MKKSVSVIIRMTPEQVDRMKEIRTATGIPMSEQVRRAVLAYLTQQAN